MVVETRLLSVPHVQNRRRMTSTFWVLGIEGSANKIGIGIVDGNTGIDLFVF
jgi:hypothetical protein